MLKLIGDMFRAYWRWVCEPLPIGDVPEDPYDTAL